MKYSVAIEKGDERHAYGVIVPDLPGCFSAGDTFEQALDNAQEAIELHIEALLDSGEPLPMPRPLDAHVRNKDYARMVWAFVDVPVEALDDSVERVNLSLPRRVLRRIDAEADRRGRTRSSYMAEAALACADESERHSTAHQGAAVSVTNSYGKNNPTGTAGKRTPSPGRGDTRRKSK
jgi:predicted RNase H-like HicB family nuclease/predicted DNA-binding protein